MSSTRSCSDLCTHLLGPTSSTKSTLSDQPLSCLTRDTPHLPRDLDAQSRLHGILQLLASLVHVELLALHAVHATHLKDLEVKRLLAILDPGPLQPAVVMRALVQLLTVPAPAPLDTHRATDVAVPRAATDYLVDATRHSSISMLSGSCRLRWWATSPQPSSACPTSRMSLPTG